MMSHKWKYYYRLTFIRSELIGPTRNAKSARTNSLALALLCKRNEIFNLIFVFEQILL